MKVREQNRDGLPWWMFAAVALIAVEFHEQQVASLREPTSFPASQVAVHEPTTVQRRPPGLLLRGDMERRLAKASTEEQKKEEPAKKAGAAQDGNEAAKKLKFFVNVPCAKRPSLGDGWVDMIKPCGNISVGMHTVDIETPFGTQYIPGADNIKPQVEQTEEFMSRYTVYMVTVMGIIYAIHKCTVDRAAMLTYFRDMASGRLDNDDDLSPEEKDAQKKAEMDPNSEDFICPGNIFRCLAAFPPGHGMPIGRWISMSFKALVSAYMQLYLPKKIIFAILGDWKVLGIKSPLWFLSNATVFVSMMAALLSLCNMFSGKCVTNIMVGAQANFWILSRRRDPAKLTAAPPAEGADGAPYEALSQGGAPPPAAPEVPYWFIVANEYFWCCLSMMVNVSMSFMLQLCMFLKIATFSGKIEHVAVVAVSLYFVFELDKKILEADPKLRAKYRKEVLEMTVLREVQPTWINSFAILAMGLLRATVPLGLLFIVLLSWKNPEMGIVIGGDGLTRK